MLEISLKSKINIYFYIIFFNSKFNVSYHNLIFFLKPATLTPFNVRHKQEGTKTNAAVAYIRYVEVNAFGNQFRLMKKTSLFSKVIPFTVNGVTRTAPFTDAFGTQIVINGGQLVLGTVFGLTVAWNGISKVEETLCDAYSTYVCGLCGNGDGIENF